MTTITPITGSGKERVLATHNDWEVWRQERYAENKKKAQAALAVLAGKTHSHLIPVDIDTVVTSVSSPQLTILLCPTTTPETYLQICFWTDQDILSTARLNLNFPFTSHPLRLTSPTEKIVILPDDHETVLDVSQPDRARSMRTVGYSLYAVDTPGYTPRDVKTYRDADVLRYGKMSDSQVIKDLHDRFLNAKRETIISFVDLNFPPHAPEPK